MPDMRIMSNGFDKYISRQPRTAQAILEKIRKAIRKAVPKAEDSLSYGVPSAKLNGKNLLCYAVFSGHIGIYPTPGAIKHFKKELSKYSLAKGTIRIPIERRVPYSLIGKIAKHNAKELFG